MTFYCLFGLNKSASTEDILQAQENSIARFRERVLFCHRPQDTPHISKFTAVIVCPPGSENDLNETLRKIATSLELDPEEAFLTVPYDGTEEADYLLKDVNFQRDTISGVYKAVLFVFPSIKLMRKGIRRMTDYRSFVNMNVYFPRSQGETPPTSLIGNYNTQIKKLLK